MQDFSRHLMENIISLYTDLASKNYQHLGYEAFSINDPKPRNIHKASVRDRLLHHAVYRVLYSFFSRTFINDSYSCQKGKGVHRAMKRFKVVSRKVSVNYAKTLWVLKCDIKKFFASIDHKILLKIIDGYVLDKDIVRLIEKIVSSFCSTEAGVGLPLGNLTSQLLVNIYMNEFDQYVKHKLKAKHYIRYADDFVLMSTSKIMLQNYLELIKVFLQEELKLQLHPDKVSIKTLASGVDFLGWVHFPHHRVLRTTTKRRMFRRIIEKDGKRETVQSYLGMLSHGNGYKLQKQIVDLTGDQ